MDASRIEVRVRARYVWWARFVLRVASLPARIDAFRWMVTPITHLAWMQLHIEWPNGKPLTKWRWMPIVIEDMRTGRPE